jgi:hypothetical protein
MPPVFLRLQAVPSLQRCGVLTSQIGLLCGEPWLWTELPMKCERGLLTSQKKSAPRTFLVVTPNSIVPYGWRFGTSGAPKGRQRRVQASADGWRW